jgi:hypothetical protein
MPWYRGVECKTCKQKLALKNISGPEAGTVDPSVSPCWAGKSLTCPECRTNDFYARADFIVFKTLDPITVGPGQITPEKKPT